MSSRSFWYGIGCDGAPIRVTGASSSQKQCCATWAAISAPIDHLDVDPVGLELAGDPERVRDHGAERDDRDVASLSHDLRRAELDRVALLRHRYRIAEEEELLLEEDHRVVVLDRGRKQAFGIERVRRHHDHEPRNVREQRLEAL